MVARRGDWSDRYSTTANLDGMGWLSSTARATMRTMKIEEDAIVSVSSVGPGGWVRWRRHDPDYRDEPEAYLRFEDHDGRLVVADLLLTGGVDTTRLRRLPLGRIEAAANARPDWIRARLDYPAPDVAGEVTQLFRGGRGKKAPEPPPEPATVRLNVVPGARKRGEDFYRSVADAYRTLAGERRGPAKALAEANGVPPSTVHRWIREARRLGYLPAAHAGKAV